MLMIIYFSTAHQSKVATAASISDMLCSLSPTWLASLFTPKVTWEVEIPLKN